MDGRTVTSIPGDLLSHTFSVTALGVNVPIPALSTVTFTRIVERTGSCTWDRKAPCDANAMATPGFMQGTLTVGS